MKSITITVNILALFLLSFFYASADVIAIKSIKQFQDTVSENKTVAAEFTARWCDECKIISPVFSKLSDQYSAVAFIRVDVEKVGLLAQKYSVSSVPTFLFFKDGKKNDQLLGPNKKALEKKVSDLAAHGALD